MGLCSGHGNSVVIRELSLYPQSLLAKLTVQSTSLITTLGGASTRCRYSQSVVIPEVSFYVSQWDGTFLWAWKFCRYSRIVVISAVVISEVDCTSLYSLRLRPTKTLHGHMQGAQSVQCSGAARHAVHMHAVFAAHAVHVQAFKSAIRCLISVI